MKDFLKYTLATLTGIFLSTLLFLFIIIMIIAASSSDKPVEVKSNTILYMKLNDRIVERTVDNPFNYVSIGLPAVREMGLNDILDNIRKAKKDDNIQGIYLELTSINAGFGTTEEIRNALLDFKESGKFVLAFADLYTQKSYYLASVADSLFLNPDGNFVFTGIGSQIMFYKGALDKLGIEAQVIRHGDYKSFGEPFTSDRMSCENREQIMTMIGSIWQHYLEEVGRQRGIEPAYLNDLAENLDIRSASATLEHGLVDGILYKDQVIDVLRDLTGTSHKRDVRVITLRKYTRVPAKRDYKGIAKDKIAVVYAHGDVILGNTPEGTIGSARISKAIRKARRDSTVKAIVLRVNSGGGQAIASDVIWREAYLAAETKPMVASMGSVAASAAYNIIAPADTILALPNSITGSIGVFAMIPNLQPFMNKKLGITVDVAKTNKHADIGTPFRALTADEKTILRSMVRDTYESFVGHVSEGRNMTRENVNAIGGGRVWSGENALGNGLIDGYGGLHDAIETAAGMAGLEKYRILELPKLEDPIEQFFRELTENMRMRMVRNELGQFYQYFETLQELEGLFGIQARMPFKLELY
jgi:protease-4